MKKFYILGLALVLGATPLLLNSCKKLIDDASETTDSAEDFTNAQSIQYEFTEMLFDVMEGEDLLNKKANGSKYLPEGWTMEWTDKDWSNSNPGVSFNIKIGDFNNFVSLEDQSAFAECRDGNMRIGGLHVNLSKPLSSPDCKITVNGYWAQFSPTTLKGISFRIKDPVTITKTNDTTKEIAGSCFYKLLVDGKEIESMESYNYTTIQTEGKSTATSDDDVYSVTGSSQGTNRNGVSYSNEITTKLIRKACAKIFVSGEAKLKNQDSKFEMITDFGDGTCDNTMVVKVNGVKHTVTIK